MQKVIRANGHDGKYVGSVPEHPLKLRANDAHGPTPRKATEGLDTGQSLTSALNAALEAARRLEVNGGVKVSNHSEERRRFQEQLKQMNRENREFWEKLNRGRK